MTYWRLAAARRFLGSVLEQLFQQVLDGTLENQRDVLLERARGADRQKKTLTVFQLQSAVFSVVNQLVQIVPPGVQQR